MEELLAVAKIVPAVNQIENHPSLPQQEIVDQCNAKGIHIMAYSPLGSTGGPLMTAEPVVALAEKKGTTPASILLSYHSMSLLKGRISLTGQSHEAARSSQRASRPLASRRTRSWWTSTRLI